MEIIVCLKQVPDSSKVRLDPVTHTMIREGVESIINPYDMYALEAALRIKEGPTGGRVIVLSMGPPQTETALREALSYGADQAILLCDRAFAGADTWATTYTLYKAVKKIERYDLILCGKQAIDGDTAQVGPGLAERLGIEHAAFVRKIEASAAWADVERLTDDGFDKLHVEFPALFTVVKEIGEIRMPSLKAKLAAKKAKIDVWSAKDIGCDPEAIGLAGSLTAVRKVFPPEARGEREIIPGSDAAAKAGELLKRISP